MGDLAKKKKKIGAVCIGLSACLLCAGISVYFASKNCEKEIPLDPKHGIADQSNLFGMCYLLEERSLDSLNIEKEVELMKNLGVKTVRQWTHFTHFMSNPTTIK